eukprot:8859236-Heterocapsa_arctica.AAC.1
MYNFKSSVASWACSSKRALHGPGLEASPSPARGPFGRAPTTQCRTLRRGADAARYRADAHERKAPRRTRQQIQDQIRQTHHYLYFYHNYDCMNSGACLDPQRGSEARC